MLGKAIDRTHRRKARSTAAQAQGIAYGYLEVMEIKYKAACVRRNLTDYIIPTVAGRSVRWTPSFSTIPILSVLTAPRAWANSPWSAARPPIAMAIEMAIGKRNQSKIPATPERYPELVETMKANCVYSESTSPSRSTKANRRNG
ncbi:MAG: hypothetical protein MZU97_20680 [Bacillus subtilis]|nr:hypothetical protein [Bacillus subtilis]